MTIIKRILFPLMAALILATAAAGCGGTEKPANSSKAAGSTASTTARTGEDGTPITEPEDTGNGEETPTQTDENGETLPTEEPKTDAQGKPVTTKSSDGKNSTTGSNGKNSTTGNQSVATTSGNGQSTNTKLDMGGYEFILGTAYYTNYLNSEGVLDPTNPLIKAVAKAEKTYNCKVKYYKFADIGSAGTTIVNAVMSGNKICDVAQVQFSRCRTVAYQDACHNLTTLKGLDLNKNFNKAMTEAFTFNKKVYACDFGPNANVQGLFFNVDLLKKYAPGNDIYALYKNGQWTEAKFEEILRKIATASGNKVTPLVGDTGILALTTAVNAGGTSYKKGNKVTFGIVTTDGVKGLNYTKRLYNDKLWKYPSDNSFSTGGAVFTDGAAWRAKNHEAVANLGWVPWPKGELNKYVVPCADGAAWCVPKTVKKKEYVGAILNTLAESAADMLNEDIMDKEDNGWSKDAIDVYKWMQNNHQIDMTTGPADQNKYSSVIDGCVFTANIQPAAAIESIRNAAQQSFDDYYAKFIR